MLPNRTIFQRAIRRHGSWMRALLAEFSHRLIARWNIVRLESMGGAFPLGEARLATSNQQIRYGLSAFSLVLMNLSTVERFRESTSTFSGISSSFLNCTNDFPLMILSVYLAFLSAFLIAIVACSASLIEPSVV